MAIAVDASTPARSTTVTTTVTSVSFTIPGDCLLVACTSGSADVVANPVVTITDTTPGALTWTEVGRATRTTTSGTTANNGVAAIHSAYNAVGRTLTVTATQTGGSNTTSLKVYVLTGTTSAPWRVTGNSNANAFNTNAATTVADNSLVICCATEWEAVGAPISSNLTADAWTQIGGAAGTNLVGLSGYISVPTSGTAQTCNLDASGTAAADWMYVVAEVVPAGTTKQQSQPENRAPLTRASCW